jgi:ribonuclease D
MMQKERILGLFPEDRRSMVKMIRPFHESITNEELNSLEYRSFEGEIVLVDTMEKYFEAIPELKKYRVLGFDTETKPTFKKGKSNKVSLLQLSGADKAFLFRLKNIGLPEELTKILSDPFIVKTGAAIHDDIKLLQNRRQFQPAGFVELQTMVVKYGISDLGLKKMTAIVLGFKISKRQQVTDWDAETLTHPQILYAATDAWTCYEIYNTLINNGELVAPKKQKNEDSSLVG